ncbi:hypothetical protein, partial [Devosia sp.]|uniref:hypothetical protein n=1 Tax=Devosia sp. TaxID=1871048 RepID=UPI00261CE413
KQRRGLSVCDALAGRIDTALMPQVRQVLRRVTVGHDRLLLSFSMGGLPTVLASRTRQLYGRRMSPKAAMDELRSGSTGRS